MWKATIINRSSGQRTLRSRIATSVAGTAAVVWLTATGAQEVPNGEMAAAIRASGNPCERVIEQERTSKDSPVWRVRCNSGHFQVTMKGDSQPEVVALD